MNTLKSEPSVALDWLTCTAKQEHSKEAMSYWCHIFGEVLKESDLKEKPWKWMSYDGYQIGPLKHGRRPDGDICIVHGDAAHVAFDMLKGVPNNVTRVDIRADVEFSEDQTDRVDKWYKREAEKAKADRLSDVTMITNLNGGITLYLGNRKSEVMLRVYDKGAQQKTHPDGLKWRVEAEFKGRAAMSRWLGLCQTARPLDLAALYLKNAMLAKMWFVWVDLIGETDVSRPTFKVEARDSENTISWLRTQVKPAIMRLIDDGDLERVEQALGYRLVTFSD